MGVKKLAEAIILQSIEDLYDVRHRAESVDFFSRESFHTCARMAGLGTGEKLKVLNLVREVLGITVTGAKKTAARKTRAMIETFQSGPSGLSGQPRRPAEAGKAREAAFHR